MKKIDFIFSSRGKNKRNSAHGICVYTRIPHIPAYYNVMYVLYQGNRLDMTRSVIIIAQYNIIHYDDDIFYAFSRSRDHAAVAVAVVGIV